MTTRPRPSRGCSPIAGSAGWSSWRRRPAATTSRPCGGRSDPAIAIICHVRIGQAEVAARLLGGLLAAGSEFGYRLPELHSGAGEVLAHCVSVLNPSMIAIGGSLSHAGRHLLAGVREVVHARAMPFSKQQLEIVRTDPSSMAAITGAAALAIDRLLATAQVSPE